MVITSLSGRYDPNVCRDLCVLNLKTSAACSHYKMAIGIIITTAPRVGLSVI